MCTQWHASVLPFLYHISPDVLLAFLSSLPRLARLFFFTPMTSTFFFVTRHANIRLTVQPFTSVILTTVYDKWSTWGLHTWFRAVPPGSHHPFVSVFRDTFTPLTFGLMTGGNIWNGLIWLLIHLIDFVQPCQLVITVCQVMHQARARLSILALAWI